MKARFILILVILCQAVFMLIMNGCQYDVAEPAWDQTYSAPPTPAISQVTPGNALPGVNLITITGSNFGTPPNDSVIVYFSNIQADVISSSASSITVRRPNIVSDSATIKVVPNKALVVAKYGPYKISPVLDRYGSFLDNLQLSALAVDAAENLYVVEATTRNVVKVSTDGTKKILGAATRTPTDAKIGPDGNLYLVGNNRAIDKVTLSTGAVSRWTQLPSGKVVRYGDFDANGFFYAGGIKTDLIVMDKNLSVKTGQEIYLEDEILGVRVFNGYVYVISRPGATTEPPKIWRNKLDASGVLGPKELILDMSTTGQFATRTIKSITFSASGLMYLGTDSQDPVLTYDPSSGKTEIMYKGILPSNCKMFYWGAGNKLYMITGDTILGVEWTVYRVDLGTAGAPYY